MSGEVSNSHTGCERHRKAGVKDVGHETVGAFEGYEIYKKRLAEACTEESECGLGRVACVANKGCERDAAENVKMHVYKRAGMCDYRVHFVRCGAGVQKARERTYESIYAHLQGHLDSTAEA